MRALLKLSRSQSVRMGQVLKLSSSQSVRDGTASTLGHVPELGRKLDLGVCAAKTTIGRVRVGGFGFFFSNSALKN